MSKRLFGVQIANGYSPEARVYAGLLRYREDAYDAQVLHHVSLDDNMSADRFAAEAQIQLIRMDMGWRANPGNCRTPTEKIRSHARLRMIMPRLTREAKKFDPDVIYSCQQHWDCFVATYLARKLQKPQIIHLHYTVGEWLHKPVLDRLLTCSHVVTVSDFIREQAINYGVPAHRVTTIRNTMKPFPAPAVSVRERMRNELGLAQDTVVIGIVARMDIGKGHADTIHAFEKIASADNKVMLVLVGDGEQRRVLEQQAAETGLKSRILFTGRRHDVPDLLTAFDIFCHPSRYDPCPLALLEAAAAGLPVVAYAEGGACELIMNGETGLLSPAGDVAELANSLSKLVSSPLAAKQMGAAGQERIVAFFQPKDAADMFAHIVQNTRKDCIIPLSANVE